MYAEHVLVPGDQVVSLRLDGTGNHGIIFGITADRSQWGEVSHQVCGPFQRDAELDDFLIGVAVVLSEVRVGKERLLGFLDDLISKAEMESSSAGLTKEL